MKTKYLLILSICYLVSCTDKYDSPLTLEASIPQSKVSLSGTSFMWSPKDAIMVCNSGSKARFVSTNTKSVARATFTGYIKIDKPEEGLWALYPYNSDTKYSNGNFSVQIPASQSKDTQLSSNFPFIAHAEADSRNLAFQSILGGVEFTLTRKDIKKIIVRAPGGEALAGTIKVGIGSDGTPKVLSVENAVSEIEITHDIPFDSYQRYFIPIIPQTLSQGLTFEFKTKAYAKATKAYPGSHTIKRATMSVIKELDKGATFSDGPSNCYIMKSSSSLSFPAYYGVSEEKITDSFVMKVLWESDGTDKAPAKESIIKSVGVSDGRITVTSGATQGNAVIAAYSQAGSVLWSWHIWVTDEAIEACELGVMDRNLGAITNHRGHMSSLGLVYQFGRKDPFPGAASVNSNVRAQATPDMPVPEMRQACDINYAIQHPDVLLYRPDSDNSEMNFEYNTYYDQWTVSEYGKSRQDPCPSGWSLPKYEIIDIPLRSASWQSENFGKYTIKYTWFPACGYLGVNGKMNDVGKKGYIWYINDMSMCTLFDSTQLDNQHRKGANACSVRCIADN